ncbi:MAG: hypothetical protein KG012_20060 [Deltaproteobacteria bacterium]|nr:hypothetical protein [Deltaproteobacteria bacterium]
METENDDIKSFVKKVFPKSLGLTKDKACPSEDELASFIDGRLKGRKEGDLISHLGVCKECLETIRFLRKEPSPEEAPVPRWLEQRVKEIFPVRPKIWEIVLGRVTPVLEIVKHNAELGLTIPGFEVVPTSESFLSKAEKASSTIAEKEEAPVTGKQLSYVPGKFQKPAYSDFWKSCMEMRAYDSPMELFKRESEDFYARKEEAHKVIEGLRSQISRGFVFQERLGDYSVYLFLTKKEDTETVEVQIETRDPSGEPVEDMEILFIEGRKALEKLLTKKESHTLRILKSNRLRIKFKHKGIYLGQAVLDFRHKGVY